MSGLIGINQISVPTPPLWLLVSSDVIAETPHRGSAFRALLPGVEADFALVSPCSSKMSAT